MLIFLGGTCGNNDWRDKLFATLIFEGYDTRPLFNPVLPSGTQWNEQAQANEDKAKRKCDFMVFYIGNPKQEDNNYSVYSLAEAIQALYEDPHKTIVVFETEGLPEHLAKVQKKIMADLEPKFDREIYTTAGLYDWLRAVLVKL